MTLSFHVRSFGAFDKVFFFGGGLGGQARPPTKNYFKVVGRAPPQKKKK
jgi:hypothetical protein